MLQLTAENAAGYLRSLGRVGPGPVRITALGGGVSNVVLRVETAAGSLVLKQSCPQLRTKDAWFSDLDRVYREEEVMRLLRPLLPAPVVPEVLFGDRENYLFAMSHAPMASRSWKEELLAGRADPSVGEAVGAVLGRMHEATARAPGLADRLGDRKVFIQLRVEPFYRRVQERRPEVAELIEPIAHRLLTAQDAICHGDYTPKNILVHAQGFTLVDYETAHFGDPTMDLGLCLAHILLKAARTGANRELYLALSRAFWQGYEREVRYRPIAELQAQGIEHLAVCLLARIDGTSPVDYLPEEPRREAVRQLARRLLRERIDTWNEVLRVAGQTLSC